MLRGRDQRERGCVPIFRPNPQDCEACLPLNGGKNGSMVEFRALTFQGPKIKVNPPSFFRGSWGGCLSLAMFISRFLPDVARVVLDGG